MKNGPDKRRMKELIAVLRRRVWGLERELVIMAACPDIHRFEIGLQPYLHEMKEISARNQTIPDQL
jgi:hypothetical protein